VISILICVGLVSANGVGLESAPKDAWPTSRGSPTMTGRASSTLPEKPELLWKVALKEPVEAGAVIADGFVYLGTLKGTFLALKLSNGEEVWRYTPPATQGNYRPGVAASAVIVGDLVVYGDEEGTLTALDRKKGTKVWEAKTEGAIHSAPSTFGDRIFVGSDDARVYCFDLKGAKQWAVTTGERVFCSPAIVGDAILTASCDGQARLLAMKDGAERKAVDLQDAVASTPAVADGKMYVGTMGDSVLCIDAKEMSIVWKKEIPNARQFFASPALTEDLMIVGARDRKVTAIERKTGEVKWRFTARGKVDSSPVVAGDRVYFGSDDGRLYALNVSDGTEAWKHVCTDKVIASPAIATGRLVVGDGEGAVFCFGAK
jgi:outer membrane protein assembly factor BamB